MGHSSVNYRLPDWGKWAKDHSEHAARDRREYELHLAAHEWALGGSLDINRREDFESLQHIAVEPFLHQVEDAILFFRRLQPRGLIADDVGLGKTVTSGLIAAELLQRGLIESILVVCPKSLIGQWQEELQSKFGIAAKGEVGTAFKDLQQQPFWITSYATARNKMPLIRTRKFDLLILDEAHALRNLYGNGQPPQVAMRFRELMQDEGARFVVMLTATPIQNRLWDIYSLLDIGRAPQPNPFGTPGQFASRYIEDNEARRLRRGTTEEFRRRVGEVTIRTRRADTNLQFPTREVRDERLAPLAGEAAYIKKALQVILEFPPLVQITHARTLMSSPWALAASFEKALEEQKAPPKLRAKLQELATEGRAIAESAKTRRVLQFAQTLRQEGGPTRLIVFTQRLETLQHLRTVLEKNGFEDQVGIIRGGSDQANTHSIADFRNDPPIRPILLSTDTGAVGLNLQAGNVVINYDLPWNPMLVEQRIGRVQRLGQKAKQVIVYNLVLRGTIEEKVVHRLMEKLNLFNQAIGEMEELLQLTGYDEEGRSLEDVIMDLVRKAALQMDVEASMQQMEESRRQAEQKLKEMREATEKILKDIRPTDGEQRLQNLPKIHPRLDLPDFMRACLGHAFDVVQEPQPNRFIVRRGMNWTEFRLGRPQPGVDGEHVQYVAPGTRAFDSLTKRLRTGIAHHVVDGLKAPLDGLRASLAEKLAARGVVLEDLKEVRRVPAHACSVTMKLSARVATDRYETLVDLASADSTHQILPLLEAHVAGASESAALAIQPKLDSQGWRRTLAQLDEDAQRQAAEAPGIAAFCDFYQARCHEETVRIEEQPGLPRDATKRALESVAFRFTPEVTVEPVSLAGIEYAVVEADVLVRNRNQVEAFPVRVRGVPISGTVLDLPLDDRLEDPWVCPGGHFVDRHEFVKCSVPNCSEGACLSCVERHAVTVPKCAVCGASLCQTHRIECSACRKVLCGDHALVLDLGVGYVCADCSVQLADGRRATRADTEVSAVSGRVGHRSEMVKSALSDRWAFPDEMETCTATGRRVLPDEITTCAITGERVGVDLVEPSAASGKQGLRHRMRASALSGRHFLPDEGQACEETGDVVLPDEVGTCARTGKQVRKDLLGRDDETGDTLLNDFLGTSEVSGRRAAKQRLVRSEKTGRLGLPSELRRCKECSADILADEGEVCPETGRFACRGHFVMCEVTGRRTLPDGLGQCEVTGKRVARTALAVCPETGKTAQKALFERCAVSRVDVLPEALDTCSASGLRVRRSLLVPCDETGKLALPDQLATCAKTGKRVLPELLVTCPETGLRLLPSAAVRCEETSALCASEAIERCPATGLHVRASLLTRCPDTGKRVLDRLLEPCEATGVRVLPEALGRCEVSGKRVRRNLLAACAESGRAALPDQLETCSVTGLAVLPSLLTTCGETGARMLRRVAVRCDETGAQCSPEAVGRCEATGRTVRKSLLTVDHVSGKQVLSSLTACCDVTGKRTLRDSLAVCSVTGKRVLPELLARCEKSGRAALPEALVRCTVTGAKVHPDLTLTCPETGDVLLQSAAVQCEATKILVSPRGLAKCDATGLAVRKSLLATDEVSGRPVQASLLRNCEKTGRRTVQSNLVRSTVTGLAVLKDIAATCAVSGAWALPEELVACAVTGKRVLPALLDRCEESHEQVLRELLRTCEASGVRATAAHMATCAATGKTVLKRLMNPSGVSGRLALEDALQTCEATGIRALPQELTTTQFSGKRVCSSRVVECHVCGRTADVTETKVCGVCRQTVCRDHARGTLCTTCVEVLTVRGGKHLDGQFERFSREQPGLKAVRVAESAKFRFVAARRPSLFHFRPTKVLVFPRQDTASFELPLAECELEPTTWTLVKQARSAS